MKISFTTIFATLLLTTLVSYSNQQCAEGQFADERNNDACTDCPKGCTKCTYNFFGNNNASCSSCETGYTIKAEGFANYCKKDVNVGLILGVIFGVIAIVGILVCCYCANEKANKRKKKKKFQKAMQYGNNVQMNNQM